MTEHTMWHGSRDGVLEEDRAKDLMNQKSHWNFDGYCFHSRRTSRYPFTEQVQWVCQLGRPCADPYYCMSVCRSAHVYVSLLSCVFVCMCSRVFIFGLLCLYECVHVYLCLYVYLCVYAVLSEKFSKSDQKYQTSCLWVFCADRKVSVVSHDTQWKHLSYAEAATARPPPLSLSLCVRERARWGKITWLSVETW